MLKNKLISHGRGSLLILLHVMKYVIKSRALFVIRDLILGMGSKITGFTGSSFIKQKLIVDFVLMACDRNRLIY
jgi:hypothetical protein